MTAIATYDVVVLGSGIAGLAAAVAAHEKGLRPIVLEKAPLVGGGTTNSYGLIWVGDNHLARAAGYADSRTEILDYMHFIAGGEAEEANLLAFVDEGPRVLKFFADCGVPFRLCRGVADHYYGVAPGAKKEGRSLEVELISGNELGEWQSRVRVPVNAPCYITCEEQIGWGGMNRFSYWDKDIVRERKARDMRGKGLGLACQFLNAALKRGIAIETGIEVERLSYDGRRVTGVALADGREIAARRGVMLATGGYESNPELVRDYEGLPNWLSQVPASITGDGLKLATEIGAAVRLIRNNMQLFLSFPVPTASDEPEFHLAGIIELCSPHTMVVNRAGERFADEAYFQGMIPALRAFDPATHNYRNLPCYLIFDQAYADTYSFAGREAGREIPAWVARDETAAGLGAKLGISATGLASTVSRFNGFARAGKDEDFRRGELAWRLAQDASLVPGKNQALGTLEKPPFYGIELRPSAGGSAGVLTNERGQVMHQRRQPIPGLYASGNTAARIEFGAGYQAGFTLASGMIFSALAVADMNSRN
jgi:3-oxosteroid 1-dehydrogenase